MYAGDIPNHEANFRATGSDSAGRKHKLSPLSVAIPGEAGTLNVVRCVSVDGDQSYYFAEPVPKERVVLHFTAGYLKGDIAALTKPNYRVSVAFVLARDGTIYNLFSSAHWSYHLGAAAVGGNEAMSKNSVAIEISNIGPLQKTGDHLIPAVSSDRYCDVNEATYFTRNPFRGYDYYAAFTDAQHLSLITLLRYCTAKFNIPRQFLPVTERYTTVNSIPSFKGIVSHVNFRTDKFDIGPAFDWQRVIDGVTKK